MKKLSFQCVFLGLILGISSAFAAYPSYQNYPRQGIKGEGSYFEFVHKIDRKNIKTIFEIGSRDAKDAIQLSYFFRCHVFAFECNPAALAICKQNIDLNPNVTLVPFGIWDVPGEMSFYRVLGKNIGASSFFQFNPAARNYPDILEEGLVQERIIVPTIRLDEFLVSQGIENIDLLCMDVQGAAFQVLCSLGDQLAKVKYIIVELETHPIYLGEVLYQDVDQFLINAGFARVSGSLPSNGLFGDVLYARRDLL